MPMIVVVPALLTAPVQAHIWLTRNLKECVTSRALSAKPWLAWLGSRTALFLS